MKSNLKKLQDRALDLWKEHAYTRDGRRCMVKKYFPGAGISHTEIMQVDHCFSRSNKHLFIDTRNSTVVCGACNMAKGFGQKSIGRAIDSIVQLREGKESWEEMLAIDRAKMSNSNWGSIPWVEKQIEKISKELESLNNAARV